ncbi:zinc finger protein 227-like [Penaeus monodon]|uniref:zinc finger protein 227-like n=1 Tax=Penaeus monodon TaxID=6687 RepID=UPI0018A6F7BE|nr:zinc finger protein 227-like [Penaeus monodon]
MEDEVRNEGVNLNYHIRLRTVGRSLFIKWGSSDVRETDLKEETQLIVEPTSKMFCCEVCGKESVSKESRQLFTWEPTKRKSNTTREKPYSYELYNKSISQSISWEENDKSKVAIHMRIHATEKPYKCEICNKNFSHRANLARIIGDYTQRRSDTAVRFVSKFSQKYQLESHMREYIQKRSITCWRFANKEFFTDLSSRTRNNITVGFANEGLLEKVILFYPLARMPAVTGPSYKQSALNAHCCMLKQSISFIPHTVYYKNHYKVHIHTEHYKRQQHGEGGVGAGVNRPTSEKPFKFM